MFRNNENNSKMKFYLSSPKQRGIKFLKYIYERDEKGNYNSRQFLKV